MPREAARPQSAPDPATAGVRDLRNVSDERFPRACRVRKRGAFLQIQQQGRKLGGGALVMFVLPQRRQDSVGPARLGITVSRRVGNAVVRNRVKRRLREIFRRNRTWFVDGRDYVVVARPQAATLPASALAGDLERLCTRCRA